MYTRQLLPLDEDGKIVGEGSADQQIEQVLKNLRCANGRRIEHEQAGAGQYLCVVHSGRRWLPRAPATAFHSLSGQ